MSFQSLQFNQYIPRGCEDYQKEPSLVRYFQELKNLVHEMYNLSHGRNGQRYNDHNPKRDEKLSDLRLKLSEKETALVNAVEAFKEKIAVSAKKATPLGRLNTFYTENPAIFGMIPIVISLFAVVISIIALKK